MLGGVLSGDVSYAYGSTSINSAGAKYCDEPDVVQCDPIEYGGFNLFLQLFKIVYYNLFYYLKIYTLAGRRY